MIDTPEKNMELTLEQRQQQNAFQNKLLNLESEVNIATKNLKGIKLESERAEKERKYQEELLANIIPQVEEKTKELKDLQGNITEKTALLNELLAQYKEHADLMVSGKANHDDRESKISSQEADLNERSQSLDKTAERMSKTSEEFFKKVAKLKEVIAEI
jgi:ABC-type transporter Mla subunit MlaD